MMLRRFGVRIKRLQRWWRNACVPRLAAARDKLSMRWLRLEKARIAEEIKARDAKDNFQAQRDINTLSYEEYAAKLRAQNVPMEERIKLFLMEDSIRLTFIEH